MNELIKLKTSEGGKKTVSAKELYEGLGLNKAHWSRWYTTNIMANDFFNQGFDWRGFTVMENGNQTMDFEISLEFAKHLAMMARTEKSHQYRNYFLVCEKELKEISQPKLSKEIQAIFVLDKKQQKLESDIKEFRNDFIDYKENSPLFSIECEELQAAVRKKGINILGGKDNKAYKDKPLRTKLYGDIQREIKRQFGLNSYKALKRSQLDIALDIVLKYSAPLILLNEITLLNNQVSLGREAI